MASNAGIGRRIVQTLGSIKTGIALLIILSIVAALGTVISQRPMTSAPEMEQKFSPATLRVLDAIGLTDVYHAWWFIVLLGLVAISIVFASIERWPNAWRFYDRPYRKPEPHFRAAHPTKAQFAVKDAEWGLSVAERALKKFGLSPQRITQDNEVSLYAERNRFAVLAVYIVHASLLLIFLGGIIDGISGYRGYLQLSVGDPAVSRVELFDKTTRTLPFSVRCDSAGQENYTGQFAGMPKRYWSKLTVVQDGREVVQKEIAVNEPLVYKGVRFYQSSYGQSGKLGRAQLAIVTGGDASKPELVSLSPSADTGSLADGTQVKMVRFIPDAYAMDGQMFQRSGDLASPAMQIELTKAGKTESAWLLPSDQGGMNEVVLVGPYTADGNPLPMAHQFVARVEMLPFTGLQVSHEPGQWAVWAGCLLMGVGLIVSFYIVHMRFWAVIVPDGKGGSSLWIGAAANKKNRESFEQKWRDVTDEIAGELKRVEEVVVAKAGK